MSYGLEVFLVPRDQLLSVPGSEDGELFLEIDEVFGEAMSVDDRLGEDDLLISEALNEIIDGKISRSDLGHVYGYAFKYLCEAVGKPLQNRNFVPCKFAWLEIIDDLLHLPVSVRALTNGKPPISLPPIDEFPFIGYWSADQIAEAAPVLHALDLAKPPSSLRKAMDEAPQVADAIREINGWLQEAILEPDCIIVGFYH
jgi:hypothetical protein